MLGQRALAADESLEAKAGATASGVSPRTEGGLLRRKLAPLPLNPPNIRDLAELQFQRMGRLPKTSHFPAISAGGRGTTLAEPTSRSTHVPPIVQRRLFMIFLADPATTLCTALVGAFAFGLLLLGNRRIPASRRS